MNRLRVVSLPILFLILFASSVSLVSAQSPIPAPTSAEGLFEEKPFGPLPPPTPTPRGRPVTLEDEEPIPLGWYIGGAAAAMLALLGLFYGTARASRSSNLFDRQYVFPVPEEPALRLGASRCGGHMATLNLDPTAARPRSKAENA